MIDVSRRGLLLGVAAAGSGVATPVWAAGPVASFHMDAPYLDMTGTAVPFHPPRPRAATLPETAIAWRPYL